MDHRIRGLAVTLVVLVAGASSVALSACGSDSSSQAKALLDQTFRGTHKVDSGNLSFSVTLNPSGSTTLTTPLTFSFGGPFQSLGTGKLPESNFTISVSGFGKKESIGLVSTGQSGFVTSQGTSYQMPAATFQKLESSFAGISSSGNGGSGSGALAKLGIHPLKWLVNPTIAGSETVAGADTTHITARVNVVALVSDISTLLQKASSLGVSSSSLTGGISPASAAKIAHEVQNLRFDVWTGKSDKTPRKFAIALTLPVTGQISTLLGGLRSADIALSLQYASLNQPQTITAPSTVRPFSEFTTKLKSFEQKLQGVLTGSLGSTSASGTASGSSATPTPTPGSAAPSVQSYSQCIQAAGTDVAKMQSCASLLQTK